MYNCLQQAFNMLEYFLCITFHSLKINLTVHAWFLAADVNYLSEFEIHTTATDFFPRFPIFKNTPAAWNCSKFIGCIIFVISVLYYIIFFCLAEIPEDVLYHKCRIYCKYTKRQKYKIDNINLLNTWFIS